MKKLIALVLAVLMLVGLLAACGEKETTAPTEGTTKPTAKPTEPGETKPSKLDYCIGTNDGYYSYRTYTAVSPSNWNELTYQDANDSDLIGYLSSSFFTYDFIFDPITGEPIDGEYTTKYAAVIDLKDVTAEYKEAWGLAGDKGYAFKITLRDDLVWDNGDPIVAEDFIYSMQEQLNPLFQNYRADSYYAGSVNIVGAQSYAKQGLAGWYPADGPYNKYSEELDANIIFSLAAPSDERAAECSMRKSMGFPASYDAAKCAAYLISNYLGECAFTAETAAAMEGKTMAEIKADETLKAAWDALIGWWQTEPDEELDFFVTYYTYPEFSWDNVGLLATGKYELVVLMTNPLELIDDEGNLTYHCGYDFSGLPLVHKATYEACKVAPQEGSTLWTTTYNSSLETTRSWGPYVLTSFQTDKEYVVERNTKWYGYYLPEHEGLYQTDRIVVETIKEWGTAWLKFLAGQIDGIGIDPTIADEYKGSSRAIFTPDDYIQSAQLQSNKEALEKRETAGVNKTILTYKDFRMAMSLAVNRADYASKCTTSSLAGFGIFNSMHYYDVANGGVYRNTDEAKEVLCKIYGIDVSKFASLDEAVNSITGYNLDKARELVTAAYNQALADGEISATDKVVLTYGSSTDNESTRRHYDYLSKAWIEMCVGTPLEGRIEIEFDASFGTNWAKDFRGGAYDICMGGWSGAAWNPGYFLLAYLDPGYKYAAGWDTDAHMMTFTMKGVGENGADITETMSLMEWYNCLNGLEGCKYDWSEAALKEEQRLQLIAALEGEILGTYYTVPMFYSFGASLQSYKLDYITRSYNTFMGYGGLKYATYKYTDEEWANAVFEQGGELDYKR